jgi:SAM-dependent methyltransferase
MLHASMGRMRNDHNPPGGISTRLVSLSAVSADPAGLNDYDRFAEAYTAEAETGLINAYYNRPAILVLAGDVAGRRILDAGCGSGPLMAALRDRGASVTGFDKSADHDHQRARARARYPQRAPPRQQPGKATPFPVLPVLRPARGLAVRQGADHGSWGIG